MSELHLSSELYAPVLLDVVISSKGYCSSLPSETKLRKLAVQRFSMIQALMAVDSVKRAIEDENSDLHSDNSQIIKLAQRGFSFQHISAALGQPQEYCKSVYSYALSNSIKSAISELVQSGFTTSDLIAQGCKMLGMKAEPVNPHHFYHAKNLNDADIEIGAILKIGFPSPSDLDSEEEFVSVVFTTNSKAISPRLLRMEPSYYLQPTAWLICYKNKGIWGVVKGQALRKDHAEWLAKEGSKCSVMDYLGQKVVPIRDFYIDFDENNEGHPSLEQIGLSVPLVERLIEDLALCKAALKERKFGYLIQNGIKSLLGRKVVVLSDDSTGNLRRRIKWIEEKLRQVFSIYERLCEWRDEKSTVLKSHWQSMSGWEFEHHVAELIRKRGYSVEVTPGSDDGGIDLLIRSEKEYIIAQCKNHAQPVGPATVRELYGTLMAHEARSAWLIAANGITLAAKTFIEDKPIKVYTLDDVICWQLHQRLRTVNCASAQEK